MFGSVVPVTQQRRRAAAVTPAHRATDITGIGRIPVIDVSPVIAEGRWPAKAVVGEMIPVEATVFREGHDAVAATAVLTSPRGKKITARMVDIAPGLDRFQGFLAPTETGRWKLRVEGWSDPYGTWEHDAGVKIAAGIDAELMCLEGVALFTKAARQRGLTPVERASLRDAIRVLKDTSVTPQERFEVATAPALSSIMRYRAPLREQVTSSPTYPITVSHKRALFSSWYEFFPRSEGAVELEDGTWRSGTLRTATQRLTDIAQMGFDTIYLTPIHPIGTTNRKGPNNTLTAGPNDPGSPYGIGSPDGGHDAIHPDLGTFEDFDFFVEKARSHGMEVALDIALQCSPDHPWVTEHPNWFTTRADGSIAYAENPPKKYQDIYPLNFDNDPEGIYVEILRIIRLWISHGVTAFRVDNPHTKPLNFWERLLAAVHATNPDVIFLSEAFTKPAMMRTLADIGFHQSYTYFTWRNTKQELETYIREVSGPAGSSMRPSFWPTTHDILPPYLQHGGVPAFAIRAVIAATASPLWGIYSGYELAERTPRPGAEELINNEKYQYTSRDWGKAQDIGIAPLLTKLNEIRRNNPALQQLRNVTVHHTSDDNILAFSSHLPAAFADGKDNTIITVVNLDPHNTREGTVWLDLEALGFSNDVADIGQPAFRAHDLLTGQAFDWGRQAFVRLDPIANCAHIIHVRPL
ncbi:alpha-1,4-glucan--maltose-1-phosphate maltosyltransferase [Jonesia quinghaiensis]|uniref:alpha-1,4-glucan--maltose-1-phosphate maltosyltransferase n=1 Tax=Jonesia quinghaiensis TaxID=262806 RepID=UPI0003F7DE87|nr:alpha-1,4-glucan--maltose-1-phosphate maltosyltransferase [Jonesia quinghaiensis]